MFVFLSDLQMDISGPKASVEKALAEVRSIEQVWREAPECRHEHVVCADCGQAIQAKAA